MTAHHRGTFALAGPTWLRALMLAAILVEWGVWRVTGLQLPSARWER